MYVEFVGEKVVHTLFKEHTSILTFNAKFNFPFIFLI